MTEDSAASPHNVAHAPTLGVRAYAGRSKRDEHPSVRHVSRPVCRGEAPDARSKTAERERHRREDQRAGDLRHEPPAKLELLLHDHVVEPVHPAEEQDRREDEEDSLEAWLMKERGSQRRE